MASHSPAQCFHAAIEAARIALKYRTPVILLSDGYLANGSEPWLLPDIATLPDISVPFATEFNHTDDDGNPISGRTSATTNLARPWAIPGTPGLMHRVGGIEKADGTGNINYSPENHAKMTELRQAKVDRIADDYARLEVQGDADADICLLGWGSTWAAIDAAVQRQRRAGQQGGLDPPRPTSTRSRTTSARSCSRFDTVIVPELNRGQLCHLVRGQVPDRRHVGRQGRRACRSPPERSKTRSRTRQGERHERHRPSPSPPRRTGPATRRSAGAPAAATTASSRPSSS